MSEEPRIRRRSRLRSKESRELHESMSALLGAPLWSEDATLETGELDGRALLLVNNELHGLWPEMDTSAPALLSVRGLLAYKPTKRFVTVDMGAVKFVVNGADVMAPGIVAVDPDLKVGDWCWIRDERNQQPLAVGHALVEAGVMVRGKGKAVKSLHHIQDKIWNLETRG